jgi:hypothetical protein
MAFRDGLEAVGAFATGRRGAESAGPAEKLKRAAAEMLTSAAEKANGRMMLLAE